MEKKATAFLKLTEEEFKQRQEILCETREGKLFLVNKETEEVISFTTEKDEHFCIFDDFSAYEYLWVISLGGRKIVFDKETRKEITFVSE